MKLDTYALNNPIIFIDPDGKRVIAETEDAQKLIINSLNVLLGEGHGFSFSKKGVLKHKKKDMTKGKKASFDADQKAIFDGYTEVVENEEYTLEVFSFEGKDADKNFSITLHGGSELKLDESGNIVKGADGKPVLEEVSTTVDIKHEAGWTGGGTSIEQKGYVNMGIVLFPDIAKNQRYTSNVEGEKTKASVEAVTVHEILDHGLSFMRNNGTAISSGGKDIKNVKYVNHALKILKSPTRTEHSHK